MGRPREHDKKVVRQHVMQCFWELGFDAASIADLEEATGINRRQLSRDYGNKRSLFLQALDDFTVFAGELYLEGMECEEAGRESIAATLTQLAQLNSAPLGHLGCLVCNTSLDPIADQDEEVRQKVQGFFRRIENAYHGALRRAVSFKEISVKPSQVPATARHLLAIHIALLVLARNRMPNSVLDDVAKRALASLDR